MRTKRRVKERPFSAPGSSLPSFAAPLPSLSHHPRAIARGVSFSQLRRANEVALDVEERRDAR
jgi:hypothetical protein